MPKARVISCARLSCLIPRDDLSIALPLQHRQIALWYIRERCVVEHLNDVKCSQPDIEAGYGLEAPMGYTIPT